MRLIYPESPGARFATYVASTQIPGLRKSLPVAGNTTFGLTPIKRRDALVVRSRPSNGPSVLTESHNGLIQAGILFANAFCILPNIVQLSLRAIQ